MSIKKDDVAICGACGSIGQAKRRGSGGMEIFLWLCFLWPIAVIYSIWRSGGGACAICGSNALMPANSPKAQEIVSASPSSNQQMQHTLSTLNAKKAQQAATDSMIWKTVWVVCGGVFLIGIISMIVFS